MKTEVRALALTKLANAATAAAANAAGAAAKKGIADHIASGAAGVGNSVAKGVNSGISDAAKLLVGGSLAALITKKFLKPNTSTQVANAAKKAIGFGVGGAALGGGAYLASQGASAVYDPIAKRRGLTRTLEMAPSLKHADQKFVRNVYDTLYDINPDVAKNPMLASAYLKRQLDFKDEGIQLSDVKTHSEIRKNFADAATKRRNSFFNLTGASDLASIGRD